MNLTPKKWQKYWYFGGHNDDRRLLHLSGLEFAVSYHPDGTFGLNANVQAIEVCKAYALANGLPPALTEEMIKTRRFEAKRFIARHIERKKTYGNDYIFPTSERLG